MSDPLAEALKVEDRKHHLTFEEGINPRCKCGYKFAYEDATHVIDLTTHAMETLATVARAFIGDEIHDDIEAHIAHHKKLRGYVPPTIKVALGAEHHAEQIARGDTK